MNDRLKIIVTPHLDTKPVAWFLFRPMTRRERVRALLCGRLIAALRGGTVQVFTKKGDEELEMKPTNDDLKPPPPRVEIEEYDEEVTVKVSAVMEHPIGSGETVKITNGVIVSRDIQAIMGATLFHEFINDVAQFFVGEAVKVQNGGGMAPDQDLYVELCRKYAPPMPLDWCAKRAATCE